MVQAKKVISRKNASPGAGSGAKIISVRKNFDSNPLPKPKTPEFAARMSEIKKRQHAEDPTYRKRQAESVRKTFAARSIEAKSKHLRAVVQGLKNIPPEVKAEQYARRQETMRAKQVDPEAGEKELKRRLANLPNDPEAQARLLDYIWNHPVDAIKLFFGIELWSKQKAVVESVRRNHFTTVRSGNAVGKTFVVAAIAVLFLMTHRPGYVILTSAGWREVERVLWPQIHEMIMTMERNVGIPFGDKPNNTFWYPDPNDKRWGMIGVAAKDKNNFAGFHNADMLVIGDEADGITEDIIQAIFGNATGENDRVLLTGNPHTPGGAFHQTFSSPVWNQIHISCLDHPNVKTGTQVIKGAVTRRWVETMAKELGVGTPAYCSRILGDFPEQDELQLIPLSWLEQAALREAPPIDAETMVLSIDVARSAGGDDTVFFVRDDYAARHLEEHKGLDTMGCVGRALQLAEMFRPKKIILDSSNMGGGVYDRMKEIKSSFEEFGVDVIIDINFAESAENKRRFFNQRAECFWGARTILDPSREFAIPDPNTAKKLLELSIVRIKPASHGKIQLESKDDIKERLKGKSPDRADAFALSCAARNLPSSNNSVKTGQTFSLAGLVKKGKV